MFFVRLLAIASAVAVSYGYDNETYYEVERSEAKMAARQRMTLNTEIPIGSFRKVGRVVEIENLEAKHNHKLQAKRVKIRYGPYSIPGIHGGMIGKVLDGTGGMVWNMPHKNVRKPCTDCMITYIHAGLEDLNGENVNTNKGLWLHHMVAINKNGRADATCGWNRMSLPHIDVGASATSSERFFSSGNERTVVDVNAWAPTNAGYYVRSSDTFSFIIDLMNENTQSHKVYMTLTYEYVPGKPSGWMDVRPIWFDADQCGVSDVKPKSQNSPYAISSKMWRANFNGQLIAMGSHLHDGGTHLTINRNGRLVCNSKANYGQTPEYRSGGMGDDMGGGSKSGGMSDMPSKSGEDLVGALAKSDDGAADKTKESGGMSDMGNMRFTQGRGSKGGMSMTHISEMTMCGNKPGRDLVGRIRFGDIWTITGYYDYNKHAGMKNGKGKQSDVMAIAIMYAAVPMLRR